MTPTRTPLPRRWPAMALAALLLGAWLAGCAGPEPAPPVPPTAPAPPPPPPPPPPAAARPPPPPPAPAPAPRPSAEKLSYGADVFFDPGRKDWSPQATARLDELARRAADMNLEVVLAIGHADATEPGAQALSQARAEAVRAYFAARGVDPKRVYAEGRGATRPVADNTSAAGRAKNRRVEIELVGTRLAKPSVPCPTDGMAMFPWPNPPQPSATDTISRALLLGTDHGGRESLGDAAARLEAAVRAAGYLNPKYLGAGCDGFALVLDMEHIGADGLRLPGAAGWAPPGQAEEVSLAAWIQRLFYAPRGRYRQIVFVVSDERPVRTTPPPSPGEFARIIQDAGRPLPSRFDSRPLSANHEVRVLVYEFEKRQGGGSVRVQPPPGRLGVLVHLKRAGLI